MLQKSERKITLKIQQSLGVNQERILSVRDRGKESLSFQRVFEERQFELSHERLQSLLKELNQHGDRLESSRSMQDLITYKQKIRDFLKEVVQNGYALEEHKGFHPNGRDKRLKLIKQVDQHLLELSAQVMEKQTPSVEILKKIGEIKGLLINIYT
jgi:uncharacterized protein